MKLMLAFLGVLLAFSLVSASAYQVEYTQVGNKIVIKESIDSIKISNYVSSEILEKSSEGYYFVEKLIFNDTYSNAEVLLNLDSGFVLMDNEAYPAGYEVSTDGEKIMLAWNLQDVKQGQSFAMFVKIRDLRGNYSLILIAVVILLVLIAAYIAYSKLKSKNIAKKPAKAENTEKKERKEDLIYEHLLDTEKKVIELLKGADRNELWQKQIQNATSFSKAKVSRLVRNLEARGLVKKIPFGNTNKVRLK